MLPLLPGPRRRSSRAVCGSPVFVSALAVLLGVLLTLPACERAALTELGHNTGGGSGGNGANGMMDGGGADGSDEDGGTGGMMDASTGGDSGGTDGNSTAGKDGGGNDAGGKDAEVDAGCADDDGDGVCNADDSCPSVPNAGDETGAACACDVAVPTGTVSAAEVAAEDTRAGFVGEVDIDGSGSNVASVEGGATVKVAFRWAATQCYFSGTGGVDLSQYIVIGLDSGQPDCAVTTSCTPKPTGCLFEIGGTTCDLSDTPGEATLKAPNAPGTYYILMDHGTGSCGGWPDGVPGADQRIGAICVR